MAGSGSIEMSCGSPVAARAGRREPRSPCHPPLYEIHPAAETSTHRNPIQNLPIVMRTPCIMFSRNTSEQKVYQNSTPLRDGNFQQQELGPHSEADHQN
jgi:hypothetical protein